MDSRVEGVRKVSVVVATHDRPRRLAALLDSLSAQTLAAEDFEVVVVDDGSGPETAAALEAETAKGRLALRVLGHEHAAGPAIARNRGWRTAGAPLVAFTDDDCVADARWLEEGIAAARAAPGAVVQGWVGPIPAEEPQAGPFSRTLRVEGAGPYFQTANIFYPRDLLEHLGGFDTARFRHSGEDTDLGWRAIEHGAEAVYRESARVHHAVNQLGALGRLRMARRWTEAVQNRALHPQLRHHLPHHVFFRVTHERLVVAALALALPRRLAPLRRLLLAHYFLYLVRRARSEGASPLLAPYLLLNDVLETIAVGRGALRYRTPII